MNRTKTILVILIFGLAISLSGQNRPRPDASAEKTIFPEAPERRQMSYELAAPPAFEERWNMQLVNLDRKHGSATQDIERLKDSLESVRSHPNFKPTNTGQVDLPLKSVSDIRMGTNFLGNELRNVSPPDNTIAVSAGGIIISIDNFTIEYYRTNGQELVKNLTLRDFVNNSSLNGILFDPKVIYDPYEDRFILVLLHGNSPSTSKVLVYFSKSNDPRDGWFVYQFDGNQPGLNVWFDFPCIGINNRELYISGNMFSSANIFQQSMLFQIEKTNGFSGGSINFQRWLNIDDGQSGKAFTIVPASEGMGRPYGPGIYLVSGRNTGGNTVYLYDLTDNMSASDEKLDVFNINVNDYALPPNARQRGNNDRLITNDARVMGAFFLNRTLHYVLHANTGNAFASLIYGRIDVTNRNATTTAFGLSGFDYTFPNVASMAPTSDPADKGVAVAFTRSGTDIFPEARVIFVRDDMSVSPSLEVKAGSTPVNLLSGNERWGDYTGIARRFRNGNAEVWMAANFAENNSFRNNSFSTWIAQLLPSGSTATPDEIASENKLLVYPNPVRDEFVAEFKLTETGMTSITLYDISGNLIQTMFNDVLRPGNHLLSFRTHVYHPGVYFLVIKQGKTTHTRKMYVAD